MIPSQLFSTNIDIRPIELYSKDIRNEISLWTYRGLVKHMYRSAESSVLQVMTYKPVDTKVLPESMLVDKRQWNFNQYTIVFS